MDDTQKEGPVVNRRRLLRDGFAGLVGWTAAMMLDPFRRGLYAVTTETPIGRQPKITIAYTEIPDSEPKRYQVQMVNGGGETARNVAINLGFEEKIIESTALEAHNLPPIPDFDVEPLSLGTVQVNGDRMRRPFEGQQIPWVLDLTVNEDTTSGAATKITQESGLWVAISYSWSFLGEQYFETDEYVINSDGTKTEVE